ncbi:MAG: hypothetical protein QM662_10280, partial [Gordonia sp. (in: high G+C Gram-positive bacteria)]
APDPQTVADALARRRRRLIADRDRGRLDRLGAVRAGLAAARADALTGVAGAIRVLAADATARCAQARTADAEVAWLTARIDALAAGVDDDLTERIDEVAATALLGIDPGGTAPTGPGPVAVPYRAAPTGRRGTEDALLILLGASSGLGVGRLAVAPLAAVHTVQWFAMPVALVLGVIMAIWVIGARRAAVRRSELRSWFSEALADVRGVLEHRVGLRIGEAESRLTSRIGRHHERRLRQITADVAAIDETLRRLRVDRSAPPAAAARHLHEALAARAHELWPQAAEITRKGS